MRIEKVEIYSDATNMAVMRHPGRRFPGILTQGDTFYSICAGLDRPCETARPQIDEEIFQELNEIRNDLWGRLNHYKSVLLEHNIPLPFSEDRQ